MSCNVHVTQCMHALQVVLRPCRHDISQGGYNETISLSLSPAVHASVVCHAEHVDPLGEHGLRLPEGVICDALMARAYSSLKSRDDITGAETAEQLAV